MSTTVLVPLRSPGVGKTRLASGLDREERAALSGAMLADVIGALRGADLNDIIVVASGAEAAAAGGALGLDVLVDDASHPGLNAALGQATALVSGRSERVLIVVADLACLTADDVHTVLATPADVVVAPTADGGTGALVRRPPDIIPVAYGPNSAARHAMAAREAGATLEELDLAGFRLDVDTLDDLERLRAAPVGPATSSLLARTRLGRGTG